MKTKYPKFQMKASLHLQLMAYQPVADPGFPKRGATLNWRQPIILAIFCRKLHEIGLDKQFVKVCPWCGVGLLSSNFS